MQLIVDFLTDTPRELEAAVVLLQGMISARQISRADNPETGAVKPPAVATLTQSLAERGMGAPPSLEMPSAAAAFGSAAAPIPPAPPVPTAAVIPPPPPALPTALPAPPAPAASSPSTVAIPPAPGAALAASVEKDSEGLPWDVRIHATNHAKNQDGSWRAKRGVNDAALVARVKAELHAVAALPGPVPPPPPATAPVEQPPAAPPAVSVFGHDVDAAIAFGATGAAPPPVPTDFPSMMLALTPAMSQGRVTQALLTEACAASGIPSLPLLATRPDLVSTVFAYIATKAQL